ncbi:MAG: monofunctional biosynthetic peptidoglycan transglycosylase [Alistipes sp.]|nr:monofunctional biosynthetic peptidoglycan transglycosylase [Alistipes sp.]
MIRYLFRLCVYLTLFFVTFSLCTVVFLRVVPVTVTPLKVIRMIVPAGDAPLPIHSKWVPLQRISHWMVQAVIATEDNNFLTHRGFDWEAINQAMDENREGKRLRGGSTITQQTAKNVFCPPSRTWFRKGIEAYYTFLIESVWSKERIMEVYLNVIETGASMYGVEAPAREIYAKPAEDLNRHEASMIATVLPNPIRMKLQAPSNYMVRRAGRVRDLMNMVGPVELGK